VTAAPSVSLYGHWTCPFATRVFFALAQRGIRHEVVDVPPSAVRPADFMLPPEFVEHSPRLEIPMVRIGDQYQADSIPILEWLEERFPSAPLLPDSEADRALVRSRMAWIDQHSFRSMLGLSYGVDPTDIERAGVALRDELAEMGRWTEDSGWLAGDRPTLAEAIAVPIYVRLAGLRRLGFDHALSPAVEAHVQRCQDLPGWPAAAWNDEQTNEFVGRFEAYRRTRARR
jgi:glutathione S-transferase